MREMILEALFTLGGSLTTGILWLIKSVYRAQKDIDEAHRKIRTLETKLKKEA